LISKHLPYILFHNVAQCSYVNIKDTEALCEKALLSQTISKLKWNTVTLHAKLSLTLQNCNSLLSSAQQMSIKVKMLCTC